MSHIVIQRAHSLGLEQVRVLAETLAVHLAERYQLAYHWQEDALHFKRTGVKGQIDLAADAIQVQVQLGLLLAMMKSQLEQAIAEQLDEALQAA